MFVDFDEIELTDAQVIDVQIAERHAVIDRLHGEIGRLEHARIAAVRKVDQR
jgi:hypothetical protein